MGNLMEGLQKRYNYPLIQWRSIFPVPRAKIISNMVMQKSHTSLVLPAQRCTIFLTFCWRCVHEAGVSVCVLVVCTKALEGLGLEQKWYRGREQRVTPPLLRTFTCLQDVLEGSAPWLFLLNRIVCPSVVVWHFKTIFMKLIYNIVLISTVQPSN